LQEQFLLYLFCEKNGWPYNPARDTDRPLAFATLMPQIFGIGHDQAFNEQLWGIIKHGDKNTSFWSCQFNYVVGSGKQSRDYEEYVFIFRLDNPLLVNFMLVRAGILSMFEEQIKTESEDFNKMFQIVVNNKDLNSKTQIINILSPSVQTRLIDFAKKYKTKKIEFRDNMMVIVLGNKLWKTKYTNFFKHVSIDQRDEDAFYSSLTDMVELPTEMVQFI
jgi:Protein of unknown function (DUF3137)